MVACCRNTSIVDLAMLSNNTDISCKQHTNGVSAVNDGCVQRKVLRVPHLLDMLQHVHSCYLTSFLNYFCTY